MSFSLSIGRWVDKTKERQDTVRRAVIIKLFSAIIKDTPVDTGRLRASWRCSVGSPDLSSEEIPAEGTKVSPATVFGQVTDAATTSLPTDTVILSNSLPYVGRIEYEGWSHTKSPEGMVRRNVARFRQLLTSETHRLQ